MAAERFPVIARMTPTSIVVEIRKWPNILRDGTRPHLLMDDAAESRALLFIVDRMLKFSMKWRASEAVVLGESAQYLSILEF